MPGATARKPQVDRSPVFMPGHYSKCCGPAFNFYRLRNAGNRFGALECLEKSIVRAGPDPQWTLIVIRIAFQEEYGIQLLPACIALVRQLLGRKFGYFSNDSVLKTISGGIG